MGERVHLKAPVIVHIIHRLDIGGMENGMVNLINQIAPLLPALADRFFSLQERKIQAMEGQHNVKTEKQETNGIQRNL